MRKETLTLVLAACALTVFSEIRFGAPFGDGMVLQQGGRVPVWGMAATGETVTGP